MELKNITNSDKKHTITIGTIFSWIFISILVLIALFLLFVFITAAIARVKNENPPISLYTIVSPSMEPKIKVYDVVINIKPDSEESIKVGDVITFHSTSNMYSARLITHRVIDIKENSNGEIEYQTKGDNNLSPDDTTVPYENIVGELLFTIPQLGRLKFLLSSVGGWLIITLIPAAIIIIYDLIKLNKLITAKNKVDTMNKKEVIKLNQEKEEKRKIKEKLFGKYKNKKKEIDITEHIKENEHHYNIYKESEEKTPDTNDNNIENILNQKEEADTSVKQEEIKKEEELKENKTDNNKPNINLDLIMNRIKEQEEEKNNTND